MLEDGFDQISFLHKSILEYHAASFVKNSSAETAEEFYQIAAEDFTAWEEVLGFLRYVDEFRYGKYYVLKYYPEELEQILTVLRNQKKDEVFGYLSKKMPGFILRMDGLSSQGFEVMAAVPMFGFHHLLIDKMEEVANIAIEDASDRAIHSAIRATKASQVGRLGIDLNSLLEHLKPDGVAISLELVAQAIRNELNIFDSIVGAERKKLKMLRPLKKG